VRTRRPALASNAAALGAADAPPTHKVQTGRKSTQRERLLTAMVRLVVRDGYASTTIAQVIAAAGVSRPTFYEYFSDRQDCFLVSLESVTERVIADVAGALQDAPGEQAEQVTIKTLVAWAASQPEQGRLLTSEAMAAGPRALEARDGGLNRIAALIEQAQEGLPADAAAPDIPPRVLLGAVYRMLARRLRDGDQPPAHTSEELVRWVRAYERPLSERRWRALEPAADAVRWAILPETQLREPGTLPRGRRCGAKELAENRRRRILYAAATVAEEKGYSAATIADITQRAGVNRRAFNALFAGKQEVFMALIAFGFQRGMAVTAGAFFTAASWPDRIWQAGRAFTEFLASSPALAHVGFVEPYAVGRDAAQLIEDGVSAFAVFLDEGLWDTRRSARPTSPLAVEAIAASIWETAYLQSRGRNGHRVSALLPHIAFLCLAPITGAAEANEFIELRLNEQSGAK
jgi:AcrR family transcriptional regulator